MEDIYEWIKEQPKAVAWQRDIRIAINRTIKQTVRKRDQQSRKFLYARSGEK